METWKDIPWYEWKYLVSNKGEVKSLLRNIILKPIKDKGWYLNVNLWYNWKHSFKKIHRLVLLTFIGESKLHCNHQNWIRDDNDLENLQYCTIAENNLHRFRVLGYKNNFQTDHYCKGKFWKHNHSSKTVRQSTTDGEIIKIWDSMSDVQRELWINIASISRVCKWKNKTAWGYKWEYT